MTREGTRAVTAAVSRSGQHTSRNRSTQQQNTRGGNPMSDPVADSNSERSGEASLSNRISGAGDRASIADRAPGGVHDAGAGNPARHPPRPTMDHHAARLRTMGAHLRNAGSRWTSHATRGNGVELMSVYKRKYLSGTVLWYLQVSTTRSCARDSADPRIRLRHQARGRRRRGESPHRRAAEARFGEGRLRRRGGAPEDALHADRRVHAAAR